MTRVFTYLLFLASISALSVSISQAQTGPGGVGNSTTNFLHLKSDAGTSTTTNNTSMSQWNDQSGNANNVTAAGTAQPTFKTGQLNGLPAINFNGTSNRMTGPNIFPTSSDYTKFVVGRISGTGTNNNFFSGTNVHAMYMSAGSLQPRLFHNGIFVSSSISMTLNTFALLSGTFSNASRLGEIFVNGASGGTGTATIINTDNTLQIGSYTGGNFLTGDETEVIAYNFLLNTTQRTIVENYLAAKYALTIANRRYNYASTHPNDVVGIGRTTATNTHLDARSARILEISEPAASSFSDGDYLLVGHDGASATAWTSSETPTSTINIQRLAREWRLTQTGTAATITLGIDNAILPALPASYSTYVILVDADGDFSSGASVYELPAIGGSQFARTTIPIADGQYITVGVAIPTIQFVSATTFSFETSSQSVQVALNYNPSSVVTVNYSSAPATATDPADYSMPSGTVSAGGSITPAIVNDVVLESDETFIITLSSPSVGVVGTNATNTYTIHDDDNLRKTDFSVAAVSQSETVTSVVLTINTTSMDTNPTTVDYAITGGTATGGGVDYTFASGTATIAANATPSTTIAFTVVDDGFYELNETIIITLTNPTNSNLGTNYQMTYTINDNEGIPVIGFTTPTTSGPESTSAVNFPISMNVPSYISASVTYTVSGSATGGGVDYTLANGTVTIPAGSTTANIAATVVNDSFFESSETIIVTFSAPINCTLGTNPATYTIVNDDLIGFTGPGGVGDNLTNKIWLRADAGTSTATDGLGVQTWNDQSGNATTATQNTAGNQPLFKTAQINALPALRFNGTNSLMTGPNVFPINNDYSKIVVVKLANTAAANNVFSGSSGHALYFFNSTAARIYQNGTIFVTSTIPVVQGQFALASGTFINSSRLGHLYINGSSGGTGTSSVANTDNTIVLGAFGGGNFLNGDIAEAIAYNITLNNAQRIIIENYLASKYALTLTSNDKYSFDGVHGFEVAGIGKEDANNLHIDAKGSGLVRINTASSLDDGDYLLWGHNGVPTATNNTVDIPAGAVSRMSRVWRSDQPASTTVGTVNISFDLTNFIVASGNDIELLLDADGIFASGATIHTTGRAYNSGTQVVSFTGVTLPAGTYFTLGSTGLGTPLPIQLLKFSATPDQRHLVVHLNWTTATEINNDFFSLDRSLDAETWEQIHKVTGSGNSATQHSYDVDDTSPLQGRSYYRLRQTDFDGKTTYSDVVTINFEQKDFLYCYPNPSDEFLTISTKKPAHVLIMDVAGKVLYRSYVSGSTRIATAEMAEGFYIVKANGENGMVTRKITILHRD